MVSHHGNREPAFTERQRGERDDLISRETVDRSAGLQIGQELLRDVAPDRFGRSSKGSGSVRAKPCSTGAIDEGGQSCTRLGG